jgi:hypothetical protein
MQKRQLFILSILIAVCGCENAEEALSKKSAAIERLHDECIYCIPPPAKISLPPYPWEEEKAGPHLKITKEFFRCKGSALNPPRLVQENKDVKEHIDCGGPDAHSLPLCKGKEFVYPIFLNLLNDIQKKTGKKVVITSGHRCPEHNTYVDPSKSNQFSKHQVGAEVAFYVRGMEEKPEKIIALLQKYFQECPKYEGLKDFQEFARWDKPTDVSTPPWYNKEVFIKLYKKTEGRNFDNRHPYPYISMQVRYDFDTKEKVHYSWDKAFRNYMRW